MKQTIVAASLAIALTMSACVSNGSRPNNQYQTNNYQSYPGVVTSVRPVEVDGSNAATKGAGIVAGAALGALLGHQVGGGRGKTVATVAGGAAGAYGGMVASDAMTKKSGYEVRVHLDRGNDVIITHEGGQRVSYNQRVRVVESEAGLQLAPM
jgi:outer membrane lipoprotein SlyB